jgi:hypothetical protein
LETTQSTVIDFNESNTEDCKIDSKRKAKTKIRVTIREPIILAKNILERDLLSDIYSVTKKPNIF